MEPVLTIIIPAKHEEHTIIPTLVSLAQQVKTPHTIIVVNVSDKKDTTASRVQSYIKNHPEVRIMQKIHEHGTFGMALREGCKAAKTEAVVLFMADSSDNPKDIDRMFATMQKGWDVVVASRYMHGGKKIGGPPVQSFFSKIVNILLRTMTGIPTHDSSNAFKMYRTPILKNIPIPIQNGVEASLHIVLHAYFSGAKITEIPTIWKGRTLGISKFKLIERTPLYIQIVLGALQSRV